MRLFVRGLVPSCELCNCKSGHGESNRFCKLLCLRCFLLSRGVFNSPEAKGNSCGVIVLPRGPEALSFASGVSICVSVLHVFMSNCVCLIFILRCFDVMVTLQELQA